MTSGLRSVRDKALYYFQEQIEEGVVYNKLYKAVNASGLHNLKIILRILS